jgi:hypothetical protein
MIKIKPSQLKIIIFKFWIHKYMSDRCSKLSGNDFILLHQYNMQRKKKRPRIENKGHLA